MRDLEKDIMNRDDLSPEALDEIESAEQGFAEFVRSDRLRGTGIRALGIKHHRDRVEKVYAEHGLGKPDFGIILAMYERREDGVSSH
jgi:hypothetical protein